MYLVVMQGRILDFQKGGWYMGVECAKVGHYRGVRECGRGVGDQRECLASCLKCCKNMNYM